MVFWLHFGSSDRTIGRTSTKEISPYKKLMNDRWSMVLMTFPHCMDGWIDGLMDWWIGCDVLWWIESLMRLAPWAVFPGRGAPLCFFFFGGPLRKAADLRSTACYPRMQFTSATLGGSYGHSQWYPTSLGDLGKVGGSNRLGSLRCEIVWRLGPGKVRRLWSRPVVNVALKNVRRYAEIQKGGNLEGWWIFDDIHWIIEGLPPMPPTPEFQLYIQCVGSV